MMKEQIQSVRRARLRALVEQKGGPSAVARLMGRHSGAYITQMCGPHPTRPVSDTTARTIEELFDLPRGWLDAADASTTLPPAGSPVYALAPASVRETGDFPVSPANAGVSGPLSQDLVREVTRRVLRYCEANNARIPADKLADVVTVVYADASRNGAVQDALVTTLVNLAK